MRNIFFPHYLSGEPTYPRVQDSDQSWTLAHQQGAANLDIAFYYERLDIYLSYSVPTVTLYLIHC